MDASVVLGMSSPLFPTTVTSLLWPRTIPLLGIAGGFPFADLRQTRVPAEDARHHEPSLSAVLMAGMLDFPLRGPLLVFVAGILDLRVEFTNHLRGPAAHLPPRMVT